MPTQKNATPPKWIPLIGIVAIAAAVLTFIPSPSGLEVEAWYTVVIFVSCIASIVSNVMPIGAIGVIGITVYGVMMGSHAAIEAADPKAAATAVTTWMNTALSGFSESLIWLIVCAILVARGVIKTGFGKRIALLMIRLLGKSSLGLAYGLAFADLLLGAAMPSSTARCGGIVYPIANALALNFDSKPNSPSSRKLGSFLIMSLATVNDANSIIFITAFTGNLLMVSLAKTLGVDFSFASWLLYASVPCIVCIILIPLLIYVINPPEIKRTPEAPELAKKQLEELGKMSRAEWFMFLTIILLLILWVFGKTFYIHSSAAAMIGLCVLLLSKVLTWDDVKSEKSAWDTLVWFAALLMMATQLKNLGFTSWFGVTIANDLQSTLSGMHWIFVLLIINAIYLYLHYFFASANAQIAALYTVFVGVATQFGVPLPVALFMLAATSSLYGSLTPYANARNPILFGSGYVTTAVWWRTAFITTLLTQTIFFTVGLSWWKIVGLY